MPAQIISDLEERVDEVLEIMPPAVRAEFDEAFGTVKYLKLIGGDRICKRCGAVVHERAKDTHTTYHKWLTLGIWSTSSMVQAMDRANQAAQEEADDS